MLMLTLRVRDSESSGFIGLSPYHIAPDAYPMRVSGDGGVTDALRTTMIRCSQGWPVGRGSTRLHVLYQSVSQVLKTSAILFEGPTLTLTLSTYQSVSQVLKTSAILRARPSP